MGESDQEYVIAPHGPRQTDRQLLLAKANGASEKGWTVEWSGRKAFTATKVRWGGVVCTRTFRIE